ncbi:MAG: hydroxylamine reductase [Marinilabiliaceae bacterium]|nr:hydroxylamine reductase [Marinilabiliaceae bacterium]
MSMFCYQCQEASKGTGCSIKGVCGKTPDVANLQDLLLYTAKGVAIYNELAAEKGLDTSKADKYLLDSLFITITNANFDEAKIVAKIKDGYALQDEQKAQIGETGQLHDSTVYRGKDVNDMLGKSILIGILSIENEDIRSLKELLTYGVKGMAAYGEHAWNLGYFSKDIYAFVTKAMVATTKTDISADDLVGLVLECGKFGVDVMALLDKAHTESFGHPEVSKVNLGVKNNPAILVSGHDLRDLKELLIQTEGTGVDVYTHSEMLPAHYYPEFKKFEHFVGNYGNAWWNQTKEFETFNGPVLFTTNCIVPPKTSYQDRIYTTGASGFDGCPHIADRVNDQAKDFSVIIEHAKKCAAPTEIETGEIVGGFAHNQVLQLADKVVDAVKTGAIKKFVVMAGCDGRMNDRNYYTDFANELPKDTVILTAGCAKYRYNKLPLGDIGGIPRVLDAGQCNDSYSLAVTALKLKEVFGLDDINDLPIVYNIAWYEQKAVIVLLALLSLGVKNIHLGPTLPAFLSPNVAKILIDTFGISGISTVEEDIKTMINS